MTPPTQKPSRHLIVNADDFGLSPGVNAGIIRAYEHGIVTSTSLMTRWPGARNAAEYARAHPDFGMGLHLDLGEWVCRDGEWSAKYEVVPPHDAALVREEIRRQLHDFRRLVGRDPDHLDSHQHAHRDEPVRSIAIEIAQEIGVPLRHFTPDVKYCGSFYGQDEKGDPVPRFICVDALIDVIQALPPGATELCCHPAAQADIDTMYVNERLTELRTLCDARVGRALDEAEIRLETFGSLMSRVR